VADNGETAAPIDMNDWNRQVVAEFRANAGKVGGMFEGAPLLLLTTTGAKSGQSRLAPLVYTADDDRFVLIASKGGAPTHPDWFHNLRANPDVTVEIGTETFPARATVPEEPERTRLYDQMAGQMPQFGEYQKMTTRQIPVVVLERTEP
jgi:deazaflavin-dependent oxidoreductase (nitroreductase family)